MNYPTYRMIVCAECKKAGNNEGCRATNTDIDNCWDASAPIEESYIYGV